MEKRVKKPAKKTFKVIKSFNKKRFNAIKTFDKGRFSPELEDLYATPFDEVKAWIMSQFTDNPLPCPPSRLYRVYKLK